MLDKKKYYDYINSNEFKLIEIDNKYICPICNKKINKSVRSLKQHIQYHFGKEMWNKGLTKETNDIVKAHSEMMKKAILSGKIKNNFNDYNKTNEHINNARKGGLISAQITNRRSKNEIYFAELCIKNYAEENILTNKPLFNGWDADIIFNNLKLAILWNGQWHYKKCRKSHSLEQTIARDKLKEKNIIESGYKLLIIKDMGKENKEFVKNKFNEFKEIINDYNNIFKYKDIIEM